MAIVNLDLAGQFAIVQGYEWRVNIYHPGNVIQISPWGQIWQAYEPEQGLAKFTFERATYDPALDLTRIPAVLNSFVTKNLPLSGPGFFVYEVRFSLPGRSPQQVMAGKCHILPSILSLANS